MQHRDKLLSRLLEARPSFEASGNRFLITGSFETWLETTAGRAELSVLAAVLEAYRGERGVLVAHSPRDPESPLYEIASDVLVASPTIGCVLIEVKSHRLAGLSLEGSRLLVDYTERNGRTPTKKDAFAQIERACSQHLDGLRRQSKRLRLPFPPVTGVLALPRVSHREFLARFDDGRLLPESHLLFEETLEAEALRAQLAEAARRSAEKLRRKLPIDPRAIDLLDRALGGFPGAYRRRATDSGEARRSRGTLGSAIDRLRDSTCLDPDQSKLAHRTLEGRPTLLRGVAGSGKSILLAKGLADMLARHAARKPASQRRLRVLVTCFNRSLVPLLQRNIEEFAGQARVDLEHADLLVTHFESMLRTLARRWAIVVPGFHHEDAERIPLVLEQVEKLFTDDPEFEDDQLWDFVFVDECQDLDPECLRLLQRLARKHEKTGDRGIALFYDDAQNLYGRPRPIWRDLGIHVTGGRTIALQRSHRTSRPIATFAFNVLLGPTEAGSSIAGTRGFADIESLRESDQLTETDRGCVVEFAQRPGPTPEVIALPDLESEVSEVVTRVRDLIRAEEVRPEEIVIETDQKWKTLDPYQQELERAGLRVHRVDRDKDILIAQQGCVTLSTIQSAKGHDAAVVFLVNANGFGTDRESRARFYVGATRAQILLVVTGHGTPEGLFAEALDALRRLPKLQPGIE